MVEDVQMNMEVEAGREDRDKREAESSLKNVDINGTGGTRQVKML
jgi:hypothetical protein